METNTALEQKMQMMAASGFYPNTKPGYCKLTGRWVEVGAGWQCRENDGGGAGWTAIYSAESVS